jgi:hypothetical protein
VEADTSNKAKAIALYERLKGLTLSVEETLALQRVLREHAPHLLHSPLAADYEMLHGVAVRSHAHSLAETP